MIQIDQNSTFSVVDIKDFSVADLPKVIDKRGYIYIVKDKVFPSHIKIGRTTDMYKRLLGYNGDKPYPTTYLYAITREFVDSMLVEQKILEQMYLRTQPTTFKKEWFDVEHLDLAVILLQAAEEEFQ